MSTCPRCGTDDCLRLWCWQEAEIMIAADIACSQRIVAREAVEANRIARCMLDIGRSHDPAD